MHMETNEMLQKANRMAEIKQEMAKLKLEYDGLEGYFLQLADVDLRNTKVKTISYSGSDGKKVTATMAESLKIVYPGFLKYIFGDAYADAVTEEITYKLSAPAKRMLTGLYLKNYTEMTVEEVIKQFSDDVNVQNLLKKKLRGTNFESDKKNLMAIAKLSEQQAEEYAYFIFEAAIWESFLRLMTATESNTEEGIQRALNFVDTAVVVEETPKVAVDIG